MKNKTSSKYTEDWLPIKEIKNNMIYLPDKNIVTGVRIEPKNIFIADQQTQNNTIARLRDFYNTIDYEFWLICCDRPVDINLYKSELEIKYNQETNPAIRKMIVEDLDKVDMFIGPEINAVDTEFYIVFKEHEKNNELIAKRVHNLITGLAGAGLNSRQINEDDARALLDGFFNDSLRTEFGTVMTNA